MLLAQSHGLNGVWRDWFIVHLTVLSAAQTMQRWMIARLMNNELERVARGRKRPWQILWFFSSNCLGRLRKTTKNLSQNSRSPVQDLNPRPPEYEAGVLTARLQRAAQANGNLVSVNPHVIFLNLLTHISIKFGIGGSTLVVVICCLNFSPYRSNIGQELTVHKTHNAFYRISQKRFKV
jgi:hypothetical protein